MWSRLVRFLDKDGKIRTGDALVSSKIPNVLNSTHARLIHGNPFGNFSFGPTVEIAKLLPPLPAHKIRTVRCLGLNYARHARECNLAIPTDPIIFHKPATAVSGPLSPVPVPPFYQSPQLDYEVELVVLIGRECYDVEPKDALKYVGGYTVGNDVSHRDWQMNHGSQWTPGKSHDGFAPIGPCIVRKVDPSNLRVWSTVNGQKRQDSNTSDMVFGVAEAVSFLSKTATLQPGDLVFMGTPEGVGMGFEPPRFLGDGDVVECGIDGIGSIRNSVRWTKGGNASKAAAKEAKAKAERAVKKGKAKL